MREFPAEAPSYVGPAEQRVTARSMSDDSDVAVVHILLDIVSLFCVYVYS